MILLILYKDSLLTFFQEIKDILMLGGSNSDTKRENLFKLIFYSCSENSPNVDRLQQFENSQLTQAQKWRVLFYQISFLKTHSPLDIFQV